MGLPTQLFFLLQKDFWKTKTFGCMFNRQYIDINNLIFVNQQRWDWSSDGIPCHQVFLKLSSYKIYSFFVQIPALLKQILAKRRNRILNLGFKTRYMQWFSLNFNPHMILCPTQTTCVCFLWHVQKVENCFNSHLFLPSIFPCYLTLIVAFMCRL